MKPTLERDWGVEHDGDKWCVVALDVPANSRCLICAIPFTIPDAEQVARAIATLPGLLAAAK